MKRLRVLFAVVLLMLFLPSWRVMDFQNFIWPSQLMYAFSFVSTAFFFLIIPFRLLKPEIPKKWSALALIALGVLSFLGGSLSGKATLENELRHCGAATYTGAFYHLSFILPAAHQDDLEARNQLCWIRKMITRAPSEIDNVKELQDYLELIRKKLLSPQRKYQSSLPMIAFLHGSMSASLSGSALESVEIGRMFIDSLKFWKEQYTEQISAREYSAWNWPHSSYIKWEYGLIENNWESIVDNISIESN